jgi:hypothetical protein
MIRALTCCLLLAGTAAAQDHGFSQRAGELLSVVSAEEETSFFSLAARLKTGTDRPRAYAILDSMSRDVAMGGMFYAYTLVGTYLHFRDGLPDSLHRKVRNAFRVRTMYRGDTENHWVMYYTGMYLAAQTWPGEDGTRWFNGKSSSENFAEARDWLTGWMRTTFTIGQGEFDSPTYMNVFLAPMLILFDFAADPAMKTRAQMTLDLILADFAAEHLRGNYCGAHSRDYPDDIINPLSAPAARVAWLYFGEPEVESWDAARYRPRHRGSWETIFGALSSYRLPAIIYRIATDRSAPYVHRETKRVRNVIRFSDVKSPPVYKYTYMTRYFALGSIQGGILQPIQQHTWDVTYVSDTTHNTLFTLHPFASGNELAMFFPEEIRFLAGEVDRYHLVYTSPDKWNSSSPYEQTFQHRGAIIVLYNVPPGTRHAHVDGFFAKTLDERIVDPSGWVFCRAGATYIAFRPVKPGTWVEEGVNWRWRASELKNGVIVEAGSADTHGSFLAFRKKILKSRLTVQDFDTKMTVEYTTTGGDRMRFTYDGLRLLNGRKVDFRTYGLFNGPFIQADVGTGVVRLKHGTKSRILDFTANTITER